MNVAVVFNEPIPGKPDSEDVLDEVRLVTNALKEKGHDWRQFAVGSRNPTDIIQHLRAFGPDVVFNLVESVGDRQRFHPVMAALFELIGLPHTGSPYDSLLVTTDKVLTKALLIAHGIPTAAWQQYRGEADFRLAIPPPVIIKPSWEDASVGIDDSSVVYDDAGVMPKVRQVHADFGQPVLIEKYIDGREFNVSVIELQDGTVLLFPPAEQFYKDWPAGKPKIINYLAKWAPDTFEYKNTVRVFDSPGAPIEAIRDIALRSWKAFNLRGYARIDMRVDERDNIFVMEANANPCIASWAGYLAAAAEAGYRPHQVIDMILKAALRDRRPA